MARYFFHLSDCSAELLDREGLDLPDLETAKQKALDYARDVLSADIKDGVLDLRYCIVVEDETGQILHSLPMENAVEIVIA